MNELQTFPVQQFYEALMSSSGLQEKLDIILKQIKTKNTEMTYQAIVHIHQILNSKLQPPLMKYNALNCSKIFFDTCEYSVILFIEVYLLPIIFQIAAFKVTKKSQEGLSLYFIERGAQPTKEVKRLGFNYVTLAIQFIYATAQVKIFRVLENQELEQQSNFKKIAKALKMRGVPQLTSFKFYNGSYIQQTRKIFIDKLQLFNPQNFIDFVTDLIFGQLTEGKHLQLDSKRLIMFGDVYIISSLVNRIEEQLNDIDGNFQGKKKVLSLFFQLVKYGYVQAILLLNSSQFLSNITAQISKVNGDKDMDEGRWIYQKIDDNQKSKKGFYLEFLKCIQTWSHAVPLNQQNDQSDAKRLFQFLKFQKKFKFPENSNLHKYKSEMQIYLRQNSERNQKVIQLINTKQSSDGKSEGRSKYKISSLQGQSNIKTKGKKTTMEFQQLQDIVINSMRILQIVGFQQKRYDKQMKRLLKFKNNWHVNLQMVKKKINEDDEPYNLDMLISEGEIVYDQIVGLQKIYQDYKQNRIKFQTAQQRITNLLNQLDEENHISEVSLSAKSRNTRLTNRRDLKSKISQKARDKSFSNHSKHSYVSQSKSAKSNIKNTRNLFTKQNEGKKIQAIKQSPNAYNKVNDTFAYNEGDKFNNSNNNKTNKNEKQQNFKNSIQSIKNQDNKFNIRSNQYGVQPQIKKTATFLPYKNSNVSFQAQMKNQLSNLIQNKIQQNQRLNENKKTVQKFDDSFQIKSPFKKKQSKIQSRIKENKKEQFSRVLFTSQDQNPSQYKLKSPFQKISEKLKNQIQQKLEPLQKKQQSVIKKVLSSEKVNFQKNVSSDSEQQFQMVKAQNKQSNKISKFMSFNNGNNVSGYFNEKSVDEYGFNGNNKQQIKLDHKYKATLGIVSNQLQKPQSKNQFNNKIINFDQDKNYKISKQGNDKFNSSKQISEIKAIQIDSVANFDDFQLIKQKNQLNQSVSSRKSKSLGKNSLKSSRLKSRINQSQISQVNRFDISQKIKDQDSFQMLQSHYKTKQIEQQKLNNNSPYKERKFGQIVQVKKQIIHDRHGVLSPINKQQSDRKKSRMRKLLQLQDINLKNSKKHNIMQVLSERSARKGIQDYMIQKQKNKLIKNLNLRIKKLQNEQKTIQTKLSRKDEQLKSMSYKNYSQKQKIKFRNQNISQGSFDNSMRDYDQSNTSLCYRLSFQNNNQSLQQNKLKDYLISDYKNQQQQNILNLTQFNKYLQKLNDNTIKKNCLRNKSLIFVNEEMEIGCMSIKKDKFINFTLFVTPKQLNLKNVKAHLQNSQNINIAIFPDFLYSIKVKKQQTFNIKILVQNVPFQIPKLTLTYEIQSQIPTKKLNTFSLQLQILIPFTLNKLCSFKSINTNDFYNMFNSGDFRNDIKITKKFKINHKIFKQQKIKQFFPYLTLLTKKQHNTKSKVIYGFQTNFNGHLFLVLLKIQDHKYAKIQTKNMTGQTKTQKIIDFFMATLQKLIS